jgi:hypothetical protein
VDDHPPVQWDVIAAPDVDLDDDVTARLAATADALLRPLYDPALLGPDPGLPRNRHLGVCRLCAQEAELTFEHIPPRSAGNRDRRRGVDAVTSFAQDDPLQFPRSGWFQSQRGVGAAVLCEPCNNWCGARLVPAYADLANDIVRTVAGNVIERDGVVYVPATVELDLPDYHLGNVSRQALVMLLAASGGAALARRWPAIERIVRGTDEPLPDELALGLSLVFGPRARLVPPAGVIGPGDSVSVMVEAAFMPFAWTLAIGERRPIAAGTDVGDWLRHPVDTPVGTRVTLPMGTVQTAGPGDYRDARTVSEAVARRRDNPESAE